MARYLDGVKIAAEIKKEVRTEAQRFHKLQGSAPKLVAILVGDDPASKAYVASKHRACEETGLHSETVQLASNVTQKNLLSFIKTLNAEPSVDGILVQLPLPEHIEKSAVLQTIHPSKDVDGFHPVNVGQTCIGGEGIAPCTPAGIIELLRRYKIKMKGANAVIIGRSDIVGKPLAHLLLREHATVTVCHSRTKELYKVSQKADLLFTALGRPCFVRSKFIKKGAVVVDVGISRISDKKAIIGYFGKNTREGRARLKRLDERGYILVGDVHPREGAAKARYITPVPGGVGPLTVAMLMKNTLLLAQRHRTKPSA